MPERRPPNGASILGNAPELLGRARELQWLEDLLDEAVFGNARLAIVSGPPGIGKTRLLTSLKQASAERAIEIAMGCCREGNDRAMHPILEALESSPGLGIAPTLSSQDLVTEIIDGARSRALCLIVDDVQWADEASLDLFAQLVFRAGDVGAEAPVSLLLIAGVRSVPLEPRFARYLSRLQREAICTTLEMEGLGEDEVRRLIQELGWNRPSHQLVEEIHQSTRGNPLFVRELVHQLARSDLIENHGTYVTISARTLQMRLPPDVSDAISTRLRDLPESSYDLLALASLLGDRFRLAELQASTEDSEAELLDRLEAAEDAALLINRGDDFEFTHPLIRQVLESALPGVRRQRYHARIAKGLIALQRRDDDGVIAIADHLIAAGPRANRETVIDYARRAGRKAEESALWRVAARLYEAALNADREELVDDAVRADLHRRAADAYLRDEDAGPCLDHYEEAVRLLRETGDRESLGLALLGRTRTLITVASVGYGTLVDPEPLRLIAEEIADQEPTLTGRIWAELSQACWTARRTDDAKDMGQRALAIGQSAGDDGVCAEAFRSLWLVESQLMHVVEAEECLRRGKSHARRSDDTRMTSHLQQRLPLTLTWLGKLSEAEAAAAEAQQLTDTAQDWGDHSLALGALVCIAALRGDCEAAERHARQAMIMRERSGYPWAGPTALPALARARAQKGNLSQAEDAMRVLTAPGRVFEEPGPAVQVAAQITLATLRAEFGAPFDGPLESLVRALPSEPSEDDVEDVYAVGAFCAMVELADFLGRPSIARFAEPPLHLAHQRGVVFSTGWPALIPRILGIAAKLRESWDESDRWFDLAVDRAEAAGATAELGRSYLDWALASAARPEPDLAAARRHLQRANAIFLSTQMQPATTRARRLAEKLHVPLADENARNDREDHLQPADVDLVRLVALGKSDEDIAHDLVLDAASVRQRVDEIAAALAVDSRQALSEYARRRGWTSGRSSTRFLRDQHAFRVIMFTDLESSTPLYERVGDDAARTLLREHDRIVRQCLGAGAGHEIKHTGDGVMAWFGSADDSVRCATDIQRRLSSYNEAHPSAPIRVRIGISAGHPIAEDGQLFGSVVNAAARICAHAEAEQILAARDVRDRAAGDDVFGEIGEVQLKGFATPFPLYEVRWKQSQAPAATSTAHG